MVFISTAYSYATLLYFILLAIIASPRNPQKTTERRDCLTSVKHPATPRVRADKCRLTTSIEPIELHVILSKWPTC
ncbi:hypothetical protein PENSPDRAFT_655103 [Peniophora sp. CONT]|nr:hypothetical protein PENSPDRAFT_655103 [Peniophora sp. CONT]